MSEDFGAKLSRWSQRKQAARRGETVDDAADVLPRGDAQPPPRPVEAGSPTATADAEADEQAPVLPPLDELTAESDYTVFLAKNVPEEIKRAALRKLWVSDPVLANLDRLNDYDEDYSIIDTVVSAVRTSYRVGKGYADEAEEAVAKLDPAKNDEPTEDAGVESPAGAAAGQSEDQVPENDSNAAVDDEDTAAARRVGDSINGDSSGGQRQDGA